MGSTIVFDNDRRRRLELLPPVSKSAAIKEIHFTSWLGASDFLNTAIIVFAPNMKIFLALELLMLLTTWRSWKIDETIIIC